MFNEPSKKRLNQLPSLYSTQDIPLQQKEVWLHFFIGGSDWWAVEFDPDSGIFFGKADLGFPELGSFSLEELEGYKGPLGLGIERDLYFTPKPISQCK